MTILLALVAGAALGYVLERGDFCFHSTIRGIFRKPRTVNLLCAYLLALVIAAPAVLLLRATGLISPWIAPLIWPANLIGGFIFGVGMVVASTCITGLFYKTGHGMLGALLGLATWALGDILVYRGPLSSLREALSRNAVTVDGAGATVISFFGLSAGLILLALAAGGAIYLMARTPPEGDGTHWRWPQLGAATALVICAGWLLSRLGGADYAYGTAYVPTSLFVAWWEGAPLQPWIPVSLGAITLGAVVAAVRSKTMHVRGESWRRYVELATGSLLMGIGAAIAGGCNLGHALVGVSLLSLGSIVTTAAMVAGLFAAHHVQLRWAR